MVRYLDEAGAYVYLFLTEAELDHGLIGLSEYQARLQYLHHLLRPGTGVSRLVEERLLILTGNKPDLTALEEEASEPVGTPGVELDRQVQRGRGGSGGPQDDEWFRLVTRQNGVLGGKWKFHLTDRDYFPSVPHGHLTIRNGVKLDAYRGYTYDTTTPCNKMLQRETREFIIGLWSDTDFRAFAVDALEFFISHTPTHDFIGQRGIFINPLVIPMLRATYRGKKVRSPFK